MASTEVHVLGILENPREYEKSKFSPSALTSLCRKSSFPFLTKHDWTKLGVQFYFNKTKIAAVNVCYPAGSPLEPNSFLTADWLPGTADVPGCGLLIPCIHARLWGL